MRDNVLSQEAISALYCPECSNQAKLNPETMLKDNDWIIEYDMDLARFMTVSKLMLDPETVQPRLSF